MPVSESLRLEPGTAFPLPYFIGHLVISPRRFKGRKHRPPSLSGKRDRSLLLAAPQLEFLLISSFVSGLSLLIQIQLNVISSEMHS